MRGDNQHTRGSDKLSYAQQAAQSLGVDERTVQRDLRRGKNITPEVLAEVSGTGGAKLGTSRSGRWPMLAVDIVATVPCLVV